MSADKYGLELDNRGNDSAIYWDRGDLEVEGQTKKTLFLTIQDSYYPALCILIPVHLGEILSGFYWF